MGGGGGPCDDNWVRNCHSAVDINLVLVGKIGNGKSATANSILLREAFVAKYSQTGVTDTCHMETATLEDGRTLNIIDTPGLFDKNTTTEEAGKKIVEFMNMAKSGFHAMLMVFNGTSRFSQEEVSSFESIKMVFGEKIVDHMILVFTRGDLVEETEWEDTLSNAPEYLQKMVELCKKRVVLFDNKTKDGQKQMVQLRKLIAVVDSVIASNGGKAFSNQMITDLKEAHDRRREVDVEGTAKLVEETLNSTIEKLQNKLQEERKARAEAHKNAEEEIRELNRNLEKARQGNEVCRAYLNDCAKKFCVFL